MIIKVDDKKIPKVRDEVVLAAILVWNFYVLYRLTPLLPPTIPAQLSLGGKVIGGYADTNWLSIYIYSLVALALFVIITSLVWWLGRAGKRGYLRAGQPMSSFTKQITKTAVSGLRFINAASVVFLTYTGYAQAQIALGVWQGLGIAFWFFLFFMLSGIFLLMGQMVWLVVAR